MQSCCWILFGETGSKKVGENVVGLYRYVARKVVDQNFGRGRLINLTQSQTIGTANMRVKESRRGYGWVIHTGCEEGC
jgi:hypothetical protein